MPKQNKRPIDHGIGRKGSKQPKRGRASDAHDLIGENGTIDWSPLFSIAEDAIIWVRQLALDAAAPPDRAAIERVCRAAYAVLDGRRGDGAQLADQLTMLRVRRWILLARMAPMARRRRRLLPRYLSISRRRNENAQNC